MLTFLTGVVFTVIIGGILVAAGVTGVFIVDKIETALDFLIDRFGL